MFERYTEKARRVIFFARYEASQFGSRLIESEHLVLGIFREDKVLANQFLHTSAAVESMRDQVESHTGRREKLSISMDLPLSEECKRILGYAAELSVQLEQKHIGTGHLLFGVLRENRCYAAEILRQRGLSLDQVRAWVTDPSSKSTPPEVWFEAKGRFVGPRGLDLDRYSLKALTAVLYARSEASQFASSAIETEHLLLGLLRADQAIVKQFLHSEAAVESIRKQIESNTARPPGEQNTPLEQAAALRLSIRLIVVQMENAIGHHEFEKARRCSDEERKLRETLRLLLEKHSLSDDLAEELPLSKQCQQVLNQGAEEATLLKQRYIGTEHLLLGILREEKSFAADILHESGLQLAQAREEISRWNQEQGGDHV